MSALSEHLTERWAIPAAEAERIAEAMETHSAAEAPAVPQGAREGGGPAGPPKPPQAAAAPGGAAALARSPALSASSEAVQALSPVAVSVSAPAEGERLSELLRRARRLKPDMERWGEDLY